MRRIEEFKGMHYIDILRRVGLSTLETREGYAEMLLRFSRFSGGLKI